MRVVAALGGNALLRRGEPAEAEVSAATSRTPPAASPSWPATTS